MKQNQEKRRLIALYIRVSTEAQAEEGYSIEAQEKFSGRNALPKNMTSH